MNRFFKSFSIPFYEPFMQPGWVSFFTKTWKTRSQLGGFNCFLFITYTRTLGVKLPKRTREELKQPWLDLWIKATGHYRKCKTYIIIRLPLTNLWPKRKMNRKYNEQKLTISISTPTSKLHWNECFSYKLWKTWYKFLNYSR